MREIKKGDIVSRNSYGNDIIFSIKRIIKLANRKEIAILKGIDVRVEADAPIEDLQKVSKETLDRCEKRLNQRIKEKGAREENHNSVRAREVVMNGKILHLDGECIILEK